MFGALTSDRNALMLVGSYMSMFLLAFIVAAFSGAGGFATGILGTLLLPLIIALAAIVLIVASIKIFWLLIKTYVTILLQIVLAPLQILMGAISQGGFSTWLRGILSNLAVYPTVGFMFVLSFTFLRGAFVALGEGWAADALPEWFLTWRTNLITHYMPFNITNQFASRTTWDPPLTLGAGSDALLWLGVSFVIITLIPKAADMIKSLVEGKPFGYGAAIGETAGAPGQLFGLGIRGVSIATDIGRAWTTRFGTRVPASPAAGGPTSPPPTAAAGPTYPGMP